MLSCFSCVWFFATAWTVAHQAPLSMGFYREEPWNGLPCPPSGDLSDPGIEPTSLMVPALAGGFFTTIKTRMCCCLVAKQCPTLVTPLTAAHQASFSVIISQSLPKFISNESVMPSNRLILCCPLHLLPSIFPSIRVFSNESTVHIRWPKYGSFSFSISPFKEYSVLISFKID